MKIPVIHFEEGSTKLDSSAIRELKNLVVIMDLYENYTLEIGGHCDSHECVNGDTLLSYQRANAVRKKLLELNPDFCELKVWAFGNHYSKRIVEFNFKELPIIEEGILYYSDSMTVNHSVDSMLSIFDFVESQHKGDKERLIIIDVSNVFLSLEGLILDDDFVTIEPMVLRKDDINKSISYNDSIYKLNVSTFEMARKIEKERVIQITKMLSQFEKDVKIVINSKPCSTYNGIKYRIFETNCTINN